MIYHHAGEALLHSKTPYRAYFIEQPARQPARIRAAGHFQVEQSEEWVTGRRYVDMGELNEHRRHKPQAEEVVLMER